MRVNRKLVALVGAALVAGSMSSVAFAARGTPEHGSAAQANRSEQAQPNGNTSQNWMSKFQGTGTGSHTWAAPPKA
jgi:hypothetical protein